MALSFLSTLFARLFSGWPFLSIYRLFLSKENTTGETFSTSIEPTEPRLPLENAPIESPLSKEVSLIESSLPKEVVSKESQLPKEVSSFRSQYTLSGSNILRKIQPKTTMSDIKKIAAEKILVIIENEIKLVKKVAFSDQRYTFLRLTPPVYETDVKRYVSFWAWERFKIKVGWGYQHTTDIVIDMYPK